MLANRILTFARGGLIGLLAFFAVRSLGLEFLPKLEEGNLWIRATFPQSVSLEESDTYVNRMRVLMKGYPEVQTVVSQHGRPDDGTDATGFFNAEFFVPLKPFDTWPAGMDKEKLTEQMTTALEQKFPGVDFNFSQYIQDNVEEAASGVKGENSVKVYGNDLETLEKTANSIAAVLAKVPGHHGPGGAALARPADHPHRRRPGAGRALRPRARRRQCRGADRHRRPERRRFV